MLLTKCFPSDLPLGVFGVCIAPRRLTVSLTSVTYVRCMARRKRTENPNYLPNFRHEGKQFVLKDIIPGDFDYILSLQKHVEHSPHVRTAVDSIPERHMLVFPYLEKGLLHVDTAALSSVAKKVIIRDALAGLADLHDKHIIHTGWPLSYS